MRRFKKLQFLKDRGGEWFPLTVKLYAPFFKSSAQPKKGSSKSFSLVQLFCCNRESTDVRPVSHVYCIVTLRARQGLFLKSHGTILLINRRNKTRPERNYRLIEELGSNMTDRCPTVAHPFLSWSSNEVLYIYCYPLLKNP